MENEKKLCRKCNEYKEIQYLVKGRNECKECKNKRQKEIRDANPERNKEYKRRDRERNAEAITERHKNWRENNKDHCREYRKNKYKNDEGERLRKSRYYQKNKEKIAEQGKARWLKNKDKLSARAKIYREKNKKERNRKDWQQKKERMKRDPVAKLAKKLRNRLFLMLRKNKGKRNAGALKLLGCTVPEFKEYLEKQFLPGMTWQNWGKFSVPEGEKFWELEHHTPISSYLVELEEERQACFHYTNMGPAWWEENSQKSDWMEFEGQRIRGRDVAKIKRQRLLNQATFIVDQITLGVDML